MKLRVIIITLLILLLTACFLPIANFSASAQGLSLGINPQLTKIEAKAGQDVVAKLEIQNFTQEAVTLSISTREFRASEIDDSQIKLIPSTPDFAALQKNIKVLQNGQSVERIFLPAGKKQSLELIVQIPANLQPRDFTFSLIFTSLKQNDEEIDSDSSFSNIRAGIGSNIILSINKPEIQNLLIKDFSSPIFAEYGPIPLVLKVANPQKHTITPIGTIRIYNMFGQLVGRIELPKQNILPESERTFNDNQIAGFNERNISKDIKSYKNIYWNEKVLFGLYSAKLEIAANNSSPKYERNLYFFALPYKTILILVIILAVILTIRKRVYYYLNK